MEWTQEQLSLLERTAKSAEPAYLRIRAMAVWHAIQKQPRTDVARYFFTTRQSIGKWLKDFSRAGIEGLRIKPGRGRTPQTSHDDVLQYVLQSPQNFGINQSRWTLDMLAVYVPSLKGFSRTGVRRVLIRLGISHKRGQPHVTSPDPLYAEKKRGSKKSSS